MIVTRVKLANVRGVEDAELVFKAGFNLIVGVNGVGKTTVLDALRICFSRVFPGLTPSKVKAMSFERGDIRLGFPFLNSVVHLEVGQHEFLFERREWRESVAADNEENLAKLRREIIETERLRERPRKLLRELATPQSLVDSDFYSPSKAELRQAVVAGRSPLAVFYPTNRSVISLAQSKAKSVGGPAAAFAEALVPRAWHIEQFVDWIRVQESLARESDMAGRHVATMKSAASRFLPGCTDITPGGSAGSLTITKAGLQLDVCQLSDGERGVLGIALDPARRLSQLNPEAADPLSEGEAIVLIDEIDLHLHPKRQRQIVRNLADAFPGCQFIATSHSPQVIGEVQHDRIQIIADGEVYSPTHSFGVDSSRVLEEIMDVPPRAPEVQTLLDDLSKRVDEKDLLAAGTLVAKLSERLGESDAEVIRARTLLDFNPANPSHRIEQRIRFEVDGAIASSDADFDTQLNDVLGLNLPVLKNGRKGVLTGILDWWKREKARLKGPVPCDQLARERARRVGAGAGILTPFDPVAVWWLDQRLARSAA